MVNACSDPQPHTQKQTTHTITDAHTHTCKHIREQIITQRLTQVLSLPPISPLLPPLLCSFPLPSNTTQNIDTSPPPPFSLSRSPSPSLSPSITHFLYWILIGCLLRGLSFKSLPPSDSLRCCTHCKKKAKKKTKQQHKGGNSRS